MTIPRTYFEQTLLESQNRAVAFYRAYLRYELSALLFILALAFASAWSEFYVSTFITASDEIKPFAVVLEMNHGQYNAYYSLFAAGATLSLGACFVLPALIVVVWGVSRLLRRYRSSRPEVDTRQERIPTTTVRQN